MSQEIAPVVGEGWTFVWNDEFENTEIDNTKWGWETNCWGGGNNELQCYTDRPENSFVLDGKLLIQAHEESYTGPAEPLDWDSNAGDRTLPYTSARLRTLGQGEAPFDQRCHLLLNVEIGGNWPGEPDAETVFPVEMEVDFVRVYTCEDSPELLRGCETVNRNAARVFGHTPPEIVRLEYDESLLEQDVVEGFGEEGVSPFLLGQYVANGSVTMTQVEEKDRGSVTNLAFNTNESVVYWQAPFGFDLREFDRVEFDMKVLVDPRESGGFVMKMDCFFPCGTGDVPIEPAPVGEWKSYSLKLTDLVTHPGSSLDLANVNTPLVIFPDWGNQEGVVMRVDNIRLVRGSQGMSVLSQALVNSVAACPCCSRTDGP